MLSWECQRKRNTESYSKKFGLLFVQIFSAYFLFCGRNFGQLATLALAGAAD
jgi:hypothetical protein